MDTKPNLARHVKVRVTQADILEADCGDPNKCMIKVAVARAIGVPHGYIRVHATGIAVTRRQDYREKAFLPKTAYVNLLRFDFNRDAVKPFTFNLEFRKTTRVHHSTSERRAQVNRARARRKEEGRPDKQYSLSKRLQGIAVTAELAAACGLSGELARKFGL